MFVEIELQLDRPGDLAHEELDTLARLHCGNLLRAAHQRGIAVLELNRERSNDRVESARILRLKGFVHFQPLMKRSLMNTPVCFVQLDPKLCHIPVRRKAKPTCDPFNLRLVTKPRLE